MAVRMTRLLRLRIVAFLRLVRPRVNMDVQLVRVTTGHSVATAQGVLVLVMRLSRKSYRE